MPESMPIRKRGKRIDIKSEPVEPQLRVTSISVRDNPELVNGNFDFNDVKLVTLGFNIKFERAMSYLTWSWKSIAFHRLKEYYPNPDNAIILFIRTLAKT